MAQTNFHIRQMPVTDKPEIESTLRAGREGMGVEFMRGMPLNERETQAKVVKASLAMVNKRDGGVLAFGMSKRRVKRRT